MKKLFVLCFITAALMTTVSRAAASSPEDDACFKKGGVWDADKKTCTLYNGYDIKIAYPLEIASDPFVEKTIDAFLRDTRNVFIDEFNKAGQVPSSAYPWALDIQYELFHQSENILSIKFLIYQYTGGAHGITNYQTFIFDLKGQKVVTFESLFKPGTKPLDVIAPLVKKAVTEQLGSNAQPDMIAEGSAPKPENYGNFVLTDTDLIFFFPPYQMAPYAAGPITVKIPLSQLSAILAPQFAK